MDRLDISIRRELLKEDAQYIGRAFDIFAVDARAIQANTRHMALLLRDAAVKDRASQAAAFAAALLDANMAQHLKEKVACARGCYYCCGTYVSASLPEIFRLARAVQGNAPTAALIGTAAARARAMPQLQREVTRVMCPIMQEGACSQYAARPLVCRAVLSVSLESCLNIFQRGVNDTFKSPVSLGALRSYLVVMVRASLVLAGLPYQNYELIHALEIAVNSPDAEERWLEGEPLFAPVAIDQVDLAPSPLNKIVDGLAGAVRPTI